MNEDLEKSKKITDIGSEIVRELQSLEKETRKKPQKTRMDLSNMTDQELRQKINRELIERQYNDLFGEPPKQQVSKGRESVKTTLEIAGGALALGSSALSIALAIKELKSK